MAQPAPRRIRLQIAKDILLRQLRSSHLHHSLHPHLLRLGPTQNRRDKVRIFPAQKFNQRNHHPHEHSHLKLLSQAPVSLRRASNQSQTPDNVRNQMHRPSITNLPNSSIPRRLFYLPNEIAINISIKDRRHNIR